MLISSPITCTRAWIRSLMAHNTPSSNSNNTLMCTKTHRSIEVTIKNIVNIPMVGVGLAMGDPMELGPQVQFGDASAELVISVTSSELSVTAKAHVLIVLVSYICGCHMNWSDNIRVRIRLRVYSGKEEARQGLPKGPSTTSRCCCCKWSKISNWAIFGWKITYGIAK